MNTTLFSNRSTYALLSVLGALMFVFAVLLGLLYAFKPAPDTFPTYFSYGEIAFRSLPRAKISEPIVTNELFDWDEQVGALVVEEKISEPDTARLYAYIATAEHDMVMLATQAGVLTFAVSPVVKGVVCEFLPSSCVRLIASSDPYSVALANIVLAKVRERKIADEVGIREYPFATTYAHYWDSTKKYSGTDVGSWKPWRIDSVQALREPEPPAPDSAEGIAQMQKLVTERTRLSEDERGLSFAYILARRGGASVLEVLKNLSVRQRSDVPDIVRNAHERMLLTQAVTDALIVAYDTKYTYWYPRPGMIDPSVASSVPVPVTPSFPSGSIAVESASAALMTTWYPDQRLQFDDRLIFMRDLYIRSGTYRESEIDAGTRIGAKVADIVLAE